MEVKFEDGKEYLAKRKSNGDVLRVLYDEGSEMLYLEPISENIGLEDEGELTEFDFVELPDHAALFDLLKGAKA